jgi:hypothetical protein
MHCVGEGKDTIKNNWLAERRKYHGKIFSQMYNRCF